VQGRSEGLEDFDPVVSINQDIRSAVLDTPENEGGFSEEQYSHFSRFFRAVRIWSIGLASARTE
jgi:hypothetical protein